MSHLKIAALSFHVILLSSDDLIILRIKRLLPIFPSSTTHFHIPSYTSVRSCNAQNTQPRKGRCKRQSEPPIPLGHSCTYIHLISWRRTQYLRWRSFPHTAKYYIWTPNSTLQGFKSQHQLEIFIWLTPIISFRVISNPKNSCHLSTFW